MIKKSAFRQLCKKYKASKAEEKVMLNICTCFYKMAENRGYDIETAMGVGLASLGVFFEELEVFGD